MAKKELVENIVKLYSKLGGNMSDVLGSRSNVTFLGKGSNPEPFIDLDINMEAVGVLGKSKILQELKSPLGYLTADKLNDVQATKLYNNMLKLEDFYYPKQVSNITDMATGTRNLDAEGLGALRARGDYMTDEGVMASETILPMRKGSRQLTPDEIRTLDEDIGGLEYTNDFDGTLASANKLRKERADYIADMKLEYKKGNLDPVPGDANREKFLRGKFEEMEASGDKRLMTRDEIEELAAFDDLPPPGSRGGPDDIAAPVEQGFEGFLRTVRELAKQDPELAKQFRTVMTNKGDMPAKRSSAREFLLEALKKDEYDKGVNFGKTQLNNVISAEDLKFITEGGGGIGGDPIVLVEKYFGPRIAEALPAGATGDEIVKFTNRVLENVTDASGLKPDNPKFDRTTAKFIDEMAEGGRAGFKFGKSAGKAFGLAKKLANINKSVDEGAKMGYQDLRKYGLEAEDITRLFKDLAMDKTMVGAEKTEYFKMLNQVLKNPDKFPDGIIEIKKRLGLDFAEGGRAGFRFGKSVFSGIANMFKGGSDDVVDLVKQENQFRTGPITEKFLGDVDKKVIDKFIRTRDTSGPGGYGMYDSLAEMPQGLQAAEFIKNVRVPGKNQIDYERAEMYIGGGIKLTGKESIDELLQMFLKAVKQPLARGGLAKILEV